MDLAKLAIDVANVAYASFIQHLKLFKGVLKKCPMQCYLYTII